MRAAGGQRRRDSHIPDSRAVALADESRRGILSDGTVRHRTLSFLFLTTAIAAAVIGAVSACTAPETRSARPFSTRDDDSGRRPPKDPEEEEPIDLVPEKDPPLPDGGTPPGFVYAHTPRALYLYEPIGKKLSKVGDFSCLENGDRMLDIAVDRDGVMYGTSYVGLLSINPTTGACSYVKKDSGARYPNSLSFVPMGTVDPTKETLVGYQFDPNAFNQATIYVKIDIADGSITKVGELNDPNAAVKYKSSGDIVALIRNGNKAYLTVKKIDADAGIGNDYLAEIDPKTGRIKQVIGDTGKDDLWGFGFWAGTGYGFSATGEILEIDMTTAKTKTLLTLIEDGGVVPWYGAGVKTFAPTAPTPTN